MNRALGWLKLVTFKSILAALMFIGAYGVPAVSRAEQFASCAIESQPAIPSKISSPDAPESSPGSYKTDAWGGKYRYGTLSTLVSSHLMWREFRPLIQALNDPRSNIRQMKGEIARFQQRYDNLKEYEVNAILAFAVADRSSTIFREKISSFSTNYESRRFMSAMSLKDCDYLEPVDGMLKDGKFTSDNFQANAHRGVHNNADLIPPNSMAALVNAYVAGIRSAEIDVLETCTEADVRSLGTCERIPVVIHDLSTNRLIGDYALGADFVDRRRLFEVENNVPIGVLNPLAQNVELQSTGIRGLMTVKRMLELVDTLLPEMTIYLDARNKTPASIIRLALNDEGMRKILKEKAIIKVYPFRYGGGADSLIDDYVELVNFYEKRRPEITSAEAKREIAELNPNLLLALGNIGNEASERSAWVNSMIDSFYFPAHLSSLPYNRNALRSQINQSKCAGQPGEILSEDGLKTVEGMTWRGSMWAVGFTAVSNVKILQLNVTPSLGYLVENPTQQNCQILEDMKNNRDDLLAAATASNMEYFLSNILKGNIDIDILKDGQITTVSRLLKDARFGAADRYPDYTLISVKDGKYARRDYYYSMVGLSYEKDGVSVNAMRSTKALAEKIKEIRGLGFDLNYFTTDLPTDVRFTLMGLNVIPSDVTYRENALIKQRFIPEDLSSFQLPTWSTQLYNSPEFANTKMQQAYIEMTQAVSLYAKTSDAESALDQIAALDYTIPLMNRFALSECAHSSVPVYLVRDDSASETNGFGFENFDLVHRCVQTRFENARRALYDTRVDIIRQYGIDMFIETLPPQW